MKEEGIESILRRARRRRADKAIREIKSTIDSGTSLTMNDWTPDTAALIKEFDPELATALTVDDDQGDQP